MALVKSESGCRVGWATYDVEAEAIERSQREKGHAQRMMREGYDFGFQSPGQIEKRVGDGDLGELVTTWRVTTT